MQVTVKRAKAPVEKVTIELSNEEALNLYAFLSTMIPCTYHRDNYPSAIKLESMLMKEVACAP